MEAQRHAETMEALREQGQEDQVADSVAFERAKRRMAVILNNPPSSVLERLLADPEYNPGPVIARPTLPEFLRDPRRVFPLAVACFRHFPSPRRPRPAASEGWDVPDRKAFPSWIWLRRDVAAPYYPPGEKRPPGHRKLACFPTAVFARRRSTKKWDASMARFKSEAWAYCEDPATPICPMCGVGLAGLPAKHVDHIIPLSRYGLGYGTDLFSGDWEADIPANLQWLCARCNLRKGVRFVASDVKTRRQYVV